MKLKLWFSAFLLIISANAFCQDPQSIEQGASDYDWQTCINAKISECTNGCANSDETDCNDNCDSMAEDKCRSEGLSPPS